MKYHKPKEGEWLMVQRNYKVACCDCSLVHRIRFRVKNGHVQVQAFRDNRSTSQLRRKNENITHSKNIFRRYNSLWNPKNIPRFYSFCKENKKV